MEGVRENRVKWLEIAAAKHLLPDEEGTEEKDDNDNVSKPTTPESSADLSPNQNSKPIQVSD